MLFSRQFVVWPKQLRFSINQIQPFVLQELAAIIKQKGAPLIIVEPFGGPFGLNLEGKAKNEQNFARIHKLLSDRNSVSTEEKTICTAVD